MFQDEPQSSRNSQIRPIDTVTRAFEKDGLGMEFDDEEAQALAEPLDVGCQEPHAKRLPGARVISIPIYNCKDTHIHMYR